MPCLLFLSCSVIFINSGRICSSRRSFSSEISFIEIAALLIFKFFHSCALTGSQMAGIHKKFPASFEAPRTDASQSAASFSGPPPTLMLLIACSYFLH